VKGEECRECDLGGGCREGFVEDEGRNRPDNTLRAGFRVHLQFVFRDFCFC